MDESRYERLAIEALGRLQDMFEDVDPDDADVESSGDVIRIAFRDGGHLVVNTQRPARQLWLAGGKRAWHFSYDEPSGAWLDDRGRGHELFATVARVTRDAIGLDLKIP